MDKKDQKIDYKGQWYLYDANLQAYRSNFISSQSLMLAVGALFIKESPALELLVAVIALIQMWYIWLPVIRKRTILSDFCKFNEKYGLSRLVSNEGMYRTEDSKSVELTEETYVKNRTIRKKANEILANKNGEHKLKHTYRTTRVKLDILLPITFSLVWIFMCMYSIKAIYVCP